MPWLFRRLSADFAFSMVLPQWMLGVVCTNGSVTTRSEIAFDPHSASKHKRRRRFRFSAISFEAERHLGHCPWDEREMRQPPDRVRLLPRGESRTAPKAGSVLTRHDDRSRLSTASSIPRTPPPGDRRPASQRLLCARRGPRLTARPVPSARPGRQVMGWQA